MAKFNSDVPNLFLKHIIEGRSIWSFPKLMKVYPSTMQKWLKKSDEMREIVDQLHYKGAKRRNSNTIICNHCKKANFWYDVNSEEKEIHRVWVKLEVDEDACVFCGKQLYLSKDNSKKTYLTVTGRLFERKIPQNESPEDC